jgi:hypothetical protein
MIYESVGSLAAGAPAAAPRRWTRGLAMVLGIAAVGLFASACGVAGIGDPGEGRDSASTQQKHDAKAALNDVISDLHALDAAYAAGDVAEARSDLDQAEADWRRVIPAATVQDQSDIQVRFDRLTNNLSSKAPARTVSDGVNAFVGELDHDVAPGLG